MLGHPAPRTGPTTLPGARALVPPEAWAGTGLELHPGECPHTPPPRPQPLTAGQGPGSSAQLGDPEKPLAREGRRRQASPRLTAVCGLGRPDPALAEPLLSPTRRASSSPLTTPTLHRPFAS